MDPLGMIKPDPGPGWAGINEPGTLDILTGIWISDSYARNVDESSKTLERWGRLKNREWGMVLEGPGINMEVGRKTVTIEPGEWYTYPRGFEVMGSLQTGTVFAYVRIGGSQADAYAAAAGWDPAGVSKGPAGVGMGDGLLALCHRLSVKGVSHDPQVHGFLWRVLQESTLVLRVDSGLSPGVREALGIMSADPTARMDLQALAAAVDMNPVTLRRKFVREVGVPVMKYWAAKRMDYAKGFLQVSRMPINSIAIQAGFCDAKHFTRMFVKQEGMTPKEYRRIVQLP